MYLSASIQCIDIRLLYIKMRKDILLLERRNKKKNVALEFLFSVFFFPSSTLYNNNHLFYRKERRAKKTIELNEHVMWIGLKPTIYKKSRILHFINGFLIKKSFAFSTKNRLNGVKMCGKKTPKLQCFSYSSTQKMKNDRPLQASTWYFDFVSYERQ